MAGTTTLNMMAIMAMMIVVISVARSTPADASGPGDARESLSRDFFASALLARYGSSPSAATHLTIHQFELLWKDLGLPLDDDHAHEDDDDDDDDSEEELLRYCQSPEALLHLYGINEGDPIFADHLANISIALIVLIESHACDNYTESASEISAASYASLILDKYADGSGRIHSANISRLFQRAGATAEVSVPSTVGPCIPPAVISAIWSINPVLGAEESELPGLAVSIVYLVATKACSPSAQPKAAPVSQAYFLSALFDNLVSFGAETMPSSLVESFFQTLGIVERNSTDDHHDHHDNHDHEHRRRSAPSAQSQFSASRRSSARSRRQHVSAHTSVGGVLATASFNMNGVVGRVFFSQDSETSPTSVTAFFADVPAVNSPLRFYIREFPVTAPLLDACDSSLLGPLFPSDASGSIAARYNFTKIPSTSLVNGSYSDGIISLHGESAILGRALVLVDGTSNTARACATILDTSKRCFSFTDLKQSLGITASSVTQADFVSMSPAIVAMLLTGACAQMAATPERSTSKPESWGYGMLFTFVVCLLSLIGVLFLPWLRTGSMHENRWFLFFVALAVGVLVGDAVLHLLPQAFGAHSHGHDDHGTAPSSPVQAMGQADQGHDDHDYTYLWRGCVVLIGMYMMWILEKILDHHSSGHGHSHSHGHSLGHGTSLEVGSSMELSNKLTGSSGKEEASFAVEMGSGVKSPQGRKLHSVSWLVIVGDGVHNFVDGLAMGASFASSLSLGISTSIAVLLHEIPHELGDFAVLLRAGMTVKQAVFWNVISSLTCFVGLFIGLGISEDTSARLWILALAAGMFLHIALATLIPELSAYKIDWHSGSSRWTFLVMNMGILVGFVIMLLIGRFEEQISV